MVKPYVVWDGNCKSAIGFSQTAFSSDAPTILPYWDYTPEGISDIPKGLCRWALHAEMDIRGGSFWIADEPDEQHAGSRVRLCVSVPSKDWASAFFSRLRDGGLVTLPPTQTHYSAFHAAVIDRLGVSWNVVAEEAPETSL